MRLRKTSCSALAILPALSLVLVGCGGSVNSTPGVLTGNTAPVITGVSWVPTAGTQVRYQKYEYFINAMDPDLGDSIHSYRWSFGDGSEPVVTQEPRVTRAYGGTSPSYTLEVVAVDTRGKASSPYKVPVAVDDSKSPLTLSYLQPGAEQALNSDVNGTVKVDYQVQVTDVTPGATVGLADLRFETGDPTGRVVDSGPLGPGTFYYSVEYRGASAPGTRTLTAACQALNSRGFSSDRVIAKPVTIKTVAGVNRAPQIVVTAPASPLSGAYTTKPVEMAFTLTDADGDPLTYVVDWGDGTPLVRATVGGDTTLGQAVTLTHVYPDAFTAGTRDAVAKVHATDNRSGGVSLTQTRTFRVTRNAYPVAMIATPVGSATLPSTTDLPSEPGRGLVNPPGPQDPELVVIPNDSRLQFAGMFAAPTSGEGALSYQWTFEGGVPASSTDLNPGEVTFAGVPGETRAYLVTFTVTDGFGRRSDLANPAPSARSYRKWVVVDGRNAQTFNLQFAYKQQIEDPATAMIRQELSTVTTAANGLGADVKVIQDGRVSTYKVEDAAKARAEVRIPVRANLPFYIAIGPWGGDASTQVLRIPNAPAGPHADPAMGSEKPGLTDPLSASSAFWFEFPTATAAPWNPTLRLVTARGFSPEVVPPDQRRFQGRYHHSVVWGQTPTNERWLDRLSVPIPEVGNKAEDPFPIQLSSSAAGEFEGVKALQHHAEWLTHLQTFSTDGKVPAGKKDDLGFVLDYAKYIADNQLSEVYSVYGLQATRVPAHTADNYDVSVGIGGSVHGWNNPSAIRGATVTAAIPPATGFTYSGGMNPQVHAPGVARFYHQATFDAPGSAPLQGGVNGWIRTYERNAPGIPATPMRPENFQAVGHRHDLGAGYGIRATFSYADYLWSSAWARPLVLNSVRANYLDYYLNFQEFPFWTFANPVSWPSLRDIRGGAWERVTSIDLTPSGGSEFNPARVPVILEKDQQDSASGLVPRGGVGRFFWTAAHLRYGGAGGSILSRTWLAGADGLPITSYAGGAGDATSAFGLIPPQDVVVDKRERDASGRLTGQKGGYRITWFNPTLDGGNQVVAPDFWVVEFQNNQGATYHFVLPAAFPAGGQSLDAAMLTDARTYLPSGNGWGNPNLPNDQVVPGFSWFDVPVELRGDLTNPGGSQTITVYGLKTVAKVPYARPLRTTDWVEALRTATATIKILGDGEGGKGGDYAHVHKIPFNFAWDIVVGQSATHVVAP